MIDSMERSKGVEQVTPALLDRAAQLLLQLKGGGLGKELTTGRLVKALCQGR